MNGDLSGKTDDRVVKVGYSRRIPNRMNKQLPKIINLCKLCEISVLNCYHAL